MDVAANDDVFNPLIASTQQSRWVNNGNPTGKGIEVHEMEEKQTYSILVFSFKVEYATKLDLKAFEAWVLRQQRVQEKFMSECRKKRILDMLAFADQHERADYTTNLQKNNCVIITGKNVKFTSLFLLNPFLHFRISIKKTFLFNIATNSYKNIKSKGTLYQELIILTPNQVNESSVALFPN